MFRFIWEFYVDLWYLFLDFIGYLFDVDFRGTKSQKLEENPFSNVPELDLSVVRNEYHRSIKSGDYESIQDVFGTDTAEYIQNTRDEVDRIVQEYNLEKVNSIVAVIPPQNISQPNLPATVIDNIIESIYRQYNADIILRPGVVNTFINQNNEKVAEIYIDCYTPTEELINS